MQCQEPQQFPGHQVPLNFIPGLSKPLRSPATLRKASEPFPQDSIRNRSFSTSLPRVKRVRGFELSTFVRRQNTIDDFQVKLNSYSTPSYSPKIDKYLIGRLSSTPTPATTTPSKTCTKDYTHFRFDGVRNGEIDKRNEEVNNNSYSEHTEIKTENTNNLDSPTISIEADETKRSWKITGDEDEETEEDNAMLNCVMDENNNCCIAESARQDRDTDNVDSSGENISNLKSISDLTTSLPDLNTMQGSRIANRRTHLSRKYSQSNIDFSTKKDNTEDRLYLYRVQDELRLKLPKTFIATASIGLMNPICILGGIRRNTVHGTGALLKKAKIKGQKSHSVCAGLMEQKRGSLGNILSKIRNPPKSPAVTPPKSPFATPPKTPDLLAGIVTGLANEPVRSFSPSVFTRAEAYAKQRALYDTGSNSSVESIGER